LLGKLAISQLEAKLTALVREKDKASAELEAVNLRMLSSNNAPQAYADIKAIVRKWDRSKRGSDTEAEAMYEHGKATNILIDQLADNDNRKRLLDLIPSLVSYLELDFKQGQYRIYNASGEVSEWRQVVY
jgi:hypothetical protein